MKKMILFFFIFLLTVSCFKKEMVQTDTKIDSLTVADSTVAIVTQTEKVSPETSLTTDSSNIYVPITLEEASEMNSVIGWRKFLSDNPDYPNKKEIEEKIIRAEVYEISKNKETGSMPQSEKLRDGNQAQSAITIENNTSCELVLRYSGPDALREIIPSNTQRKIIIGSGKYQVAATACGHNYAGVEVLSGDYEVVYYIQTVSY